MKTVDPFSEFSLPARPAIDVGLLQQGFDRRARELHPDAGGDTASFARLEQARAILLNPARRIAALLEILGAAKPALVGAPPADISDAIFNAATAGTALRTAGEMSPPETSVAKAVFRRTHSATADAAREALAVLEAAAANANERIADCDRLWDQMQPAQRIAALRELHPRIAFLQRARDTLEATIVEAAGVGL